MKNIAIIGGSIAGCAMALVLTRCGFNVTIYERSTSALSDRGAGICIPEELHNLLIKQNIFDEDINHLKINTRQFIRSGSQREADVFWHHDLRPVAYNWSEIYQQLYKRLPKNICQTGQKIISFEQDKDSVKLYLSSGKSIDADWVICADGINSEARTCLFPETKTKEAAYIAWRGVVPKSKVEMPELYEALNYFCYDIGHVVSYYIPNNQDSFELNWVAYQCVSDREKHQLLTNMQGVFSPISLPPNMFTPWHKEKLAELTSKLPATFAKTVCLTPAPFIQNIFDAAPPSLIKGNICLTGDAAFISRPHTAGGATKALQSALVLQKYLHSYEKDLNKAFYAWADEQFATEKKLYQLGEIFGRELVTNPIDWGKMDQKMMNNWWSEVLQGKSWYKSKAKNI